MPRKIDFVLASEVHRQERGLDLPAVQTEKLVPRVSLLDLAVLGVAAGLLEELLDIDAAAFGREDEVLADLLDLGQLPSPVRRAGLRSGRGCP